MLDVRQCSIKQKGINATVWKSKKFLPIQILREINVELDSLVQKQFQALSCENEILVFSTVEFYCRHYFFVKFRETKMLTLKLYFRNWRIFLCGRKLSFFHTAVLTVRFSLAKISWK